MCPLAVRNPFVAVKISMVYIMSDMLADVTVPNGSFGIILKIVGICVNIRGFV